MDTIINTTKTWLQDRVIKKEEYHKKEIKPTRDWQLLLSIFACLFIALSFVSAVLYRKSQDGTLFVTSTIENKTPMSVNDNLLSETIGAINTTTTMIQNIRTESLFTSDPSL